MSLLNLDHLPVSQKPYTAYSHTMKKQRLKYIKQTFLTLLEIIFPGESCEIYEKLAKEELASQTPKDTSCDFILDGLMASYNKAETWQAKRQILSVLASTLSYTETSELIQGITQCRYYIAQKHALYYGAALPVEPTNTTRARMDLEKLDNFMEFITSPHIVKDLPYGEKKIKLSTGETISTSNVIRSMGPAAIISQYKLLCVEQNFSPPGNNFVSCSFLAQLR